MSIIFKYFEIYSGFLNGRNYIEGLIHCNIASYLSIFFLLLLFLETWNHFLTKRRWSHSETDSMTSSCHRTDIVSRLNGKIIASFTEFKPRPKCYFKYRVSVDSIHCKTDLTNIPREGGKLSQFFCLNPLN